jgi:glycosyltransferase involved in cell wall biosynthesis
LRLRERLSLAIFVAVGLPVYILVRGITGVLELTRWPRLLPRLQAVLGIRRRVLYLEVFHPEASGYVYRVKNWARVLSDAGFTVRIKHPLSPSMSERLLGGGWTGLFFTAYMLRRLAQCFRAPLYNLVIVRRELLLFNDYGNLFMERLLLALNPNVALDFDDDISAAKGEPRSLSPLGRALRESPTKFADSLRLYPRFIAGSEYLERLLFDRRGSVGEGNVVVIPTCVSYGDELTKRYGDEAPPLTFGWIGTNGNLPELERIVPALEEVARRTRLRLLVISGRDLEAEASFLIENRRWSLATEIGDLREIDVGVMPLADTPRTRGKCGFKLIQYMGLGIVSVATAITTNCDIVSDGVDGFLVAPGASWVPALEHVIDARDQFATIGRAARTKIARDYSVDAHADRYLDFVRSSVIASGGGRR